MITPACPRPRRPACATPALVFAALLSCVAGCGEEDIRHGRTVRTTFAMSGFLGHPDWAIVELTVFQLSASEESARPAPAADKYPYDVFARIGGAHYSGTAATSSELIFVTLTPRDVNDDGRTDLRFRIERPGSGAATSDRFDVAIETETWRRDFGKSPAPPPFRVRADVVNADGQRLATTGLVDVAADTMLAADATLVLPPLQAP